MSTSPLFTTTTPADTHSYIDTIFEHEVLNRKLYFRQIRARSVALNASPDDLTYDKIAEVNLVNFRQAIFSHPHGLILIAWDISTRGCTMTVAASTPAWANKIHEDLVQSLPQRILPPNREEVFMSFWSLGATGARNIDRPIAIAPWEKVQNNYPVQTNQALVNLMEGFKPSKAGQLVLWYGPPGTGKTHALRALAWEWRKWCSFHYITDPEVFFGGNATYMLDVLLTRGGALIDDSPDDDDDDHPLPHVPAPSASKERKWRLLILEDSGELMVPDAKTQTGQGLSRLLNTVDGLIGQGLRIMVLVTTNEILKKLHPAVARPGRCAARIEFAEFKRDEAKVWLKAHDVDMPPVGLNPVVSLAELYALLGDGQTIAEVQSKGMGF